MVKFVYYETLIIWHTGVYIYMHVTIFDRPYAFSNASQSTLKFCKASKANAGRDLETLRG